MEYKFSQFSLYLVNLIEKKKYCCYNKGNRLQMGGYSMRKKLLAMSIGPIVLIGIVIILVCHYNVTKLINDQIENALRGTAIATLAAYDQNMGDYMEGDNGEIWKGGYNISKSEELVDNIKNHSDMEVSFIYGDTRIMTSALDDKGNRILGSKVGSKVIDEVLNNGHEYFSSKVMIEDERYYGFYLPVRQSSNNEEVVGMIFVGTNKADRDLEKDVVVYKLILIILVSVIVCALVTVFIANSIAKALTKSVDVVKAVSMGNLNIDFDKKESERKDEIGEIYRALGKLQEGLRKLISRVNKQTNVLVTSSNALSDTAIVTMASVSSVEQAVESVARGAMDQAKGVQQASSDMGEIQIGITGIRDEVQGLSERTVDMVDVGNRALVSIQSLNEINELVNEAIENIHAQTNKTQISSERIKQAVQIITSIANETNLLSLNARIEAARAGEQGKGFAVVANQIQQLAHESNKSSNEIAKAIEELTLDANHAVEIMDQVKEVILKQSEDIHMTNEMFEKVKENITLVDESIGQIGQHTQTIEEKYVGICGVIEDLTAIAEENAASTQETSSSAAEVTEAINKVSSEANALKKVSDKIAKSLSEFKL